MLGIQGSDTDNTNKKADSTLENFIWLMSTNHS